MNLNHSALNPTSHFPVLLALCLPFGGGGTLADPPPAPEGFRWEPDPRFTDEFDGALLDPGKWHDHHPRWRGRPPAKFVPSAVSVTNGCLVIRAGVLEEPDGAFTLSDGAVVSRSEEAFHGYYEARMKASQISMSSTFWMSNRSVREGDASVSHELDITETVGAPEAGPPWAREWNRFMNSNTHYFRSVRGAKENLATPGKAPLDPPAGETFHTYGAWWVDANTVHFYLDDEFVFTLRPSTKYSTTPFDRPMHVNLVVETYDWMAPPSIEDVTNPAINATRYDWVRAYRLQALGEGE
jgi:beta-glucanase (GH16 family)